MQINTLYSKTIFLTLRIALHLGVVPPLTWSTPYLLFNNT